VNVRNSDVHATVVPSLGIGEGLTTAHRKKPDCYEILHRASELRGSFERGNEPSGSIKGREFLD
jgi:hypothetical protein